MRSSNPDSSAFTRGKPSAPPVNAGNYFWRAATIAEPAGGAPDQGPFAPAQPFSVDLLSLVNGTSIPRVAVAGGGLSGLTAALNLAATRKVAVLAKGALGQADIAHLRRRAEQARQCGEAEAVS